MAPLQTLTQPSRHECTHTAARQRTAWAGWPGQAALAVLCLVASGVQAQTATPTPPPGTQRQHELVRMVRQDCGSCHGLRLTGGLGPALTAEALAAKPLDAITATIYGGRPGTPMAPWKAMLNEADALWIAQQLLAGFPEMTKDH